MPELDHLARIALAIDVGIAVIQFAAVVGPWAVAPKRTRSLWAAGLMMFAGGLAVLLYGFAGQFKAMLLNIPFDAVSVWGLIGFTIFNAGSAWWLKEHHLCGRS